MDTEEGMGNEVDGAGVIAADHSDGTAEYWKRKCMSLKKQVDMLIAANKTVGEQLETKTREVQKLTRALDKDEDDKKLISSRSFISALPEEVCQIATC